MKSRYDEFEFLRKSCFIGWINFIGLFYIMMSLKTGVDDSIKYLPIAVMIVSYAGALFYYIGWTKVFTKVSRKEGRKYFSPYIISALLFTIFWVLWLLSLIQAMYQSFN